MKEVWKDIEGYEGLYQVSNLGRVKSLKRKRYDINNKKIIYENKIKIIKGQDTKKGYLLVRLYKNNCYTIKSIHRLVAEAFIPNPDNLPQVNHKDENVANNIVSNLEWCTNEYNINYGSRLKRVSESMKGKNNKSVCQYDMNGNLIKTFDSITIAGKELNISDSGISQCCKNKLKSFHNYIWKYKGDDNNVECTNKAKISC